MITDFSNVKRLIPALLAIFVVIALGISSCNTIDARVKYSVTGDSNNFYIEYLDENGDTIIRDGIKSDWSYAYPSERGNPIYFLARANNDGSVRARVFIDARLYLDENKRGLDSTIIFNETVQVVF